MLRLFNMQTLTFNRYVAGSWVSGRWVEGTTTPIPDVQCNIQPYQEGKDSVVLPEGIKANDAFICYTESDIETTDQYDDQAADTVEIDGRTFVAMKAADWSKFPTMRLNHHKVLLVRRDQDTNGGL